MYKIEAKNILTPQNGLNLYCGRTENLILLREIPKQDPMDTGFKPDADALLELTLRKRRSKGMILMGHLGDPYPPQEAEMGLTRRVLKVIEGNDYGAVIETRSRGLLRDLDILKDIARKTKCVAVIPVPSLNPDIFGGIEGVPDGRAELEARLDLVCKVRDAGIGTVIRIAPLIPKLNSSPENVAAVTEKAAALQADAVECQPEHTLKEAGQAFFEKAYAERFPEQYAAFAAGRKKRDIRPANLKELKMVLAETGRAVGIETDPAVIRTFLRQYENHTVGQQMTLEDFGISLEKGKE